MTGDSLREMPYRALMERIAGHFGSAGYSVSVKDGILWLAKEGFKGAVWVVPADGGLDELLSAVMGATEYLNRYGASYIALPLQLAKRIDESHFWTYGIGLIVYDDEVLREVLQPRLRKEESLAPERAQEDIVRSAEGGAATVFNDTLVEDLLSRVERIERELRRLDEMDYLVARLEALEKRMRDSPAREERPSQSPAPMKVYAEAAQTPAKAGAPPYSSLPSFLQGNPWIEVLTQKR
ncbi:MAG: hypothetical protein QW555_03920 [Nitrososphaerota archaeon]